MGRAQGAPHCMEEDKKLGRWEVVFAAFAFSLLDKAVMF